VYQRWYTDSIPEDSYYLVKRTLSIEEILAGTYRRGQIIIRLDTAGNSSQRADADPFRRRDNREEQKKSGKKKPDGPHTAACAA
jgi:hypothetical protein